MNLALAHRDELARNNYVRKADPSVDYWFDFSARKLNEYKEIAGGDFKLIIIGAAKLEADFYAIPFKAVEDIFIEENLSSDKGGSTRWVGNVFGHTLKLRNCTTTKDVALFYGNPLLLGGDSRPAWSSNLDAQEEDNEYSIENRKMEIFVRQKQSAFRKNVLKNFDQRCCISALTETNLLRASHIVPWAHRVDCRLDPSNGLCLSIAYDHLFDQGFIGFTETLKVVITPAYREFSAPLQTILEQIDSRQASLPKVYSISKDYLCYHREKILIGT